MKRENAIRATDVPVPISPRLKDGDIGSSRVMATATRHGVDRHESSIEIRRDDVPLMASRGGVADQTVVARLPVGVGARDKRSRFEQCLGELSVDGRQIIDARHRAEKLPWKPEIPED